MGLLKTDYARVVIPDIEGYPQWIKVPAGIVVKLTDLRTTLANAMDEELDDYKNNFAIAYETNPRIRALTDEILRLCKLDPSRWDIASIIGLVIGWQDTSGQFHEGTLFRLARGEHDDLVAEVFESEETTTLEKQVASIRQRLISFGLAQDLAGAEQAMQTYTFDELEMMISSAWQAIDPKGWRRERNREETRKRLSDQIREAQQREAQDQVSPEVHEPKPNFSKTTKPVSQTSGSGKPDESDRPGGNKIIPPDSRLLR